MFPPMSPLTERVRVELENQQIAREAAAREQFSGTGSGLHQLRAVFVALWRRNASSNAGAMEPYANSQLPDTRRNSRRVFKTLS
jgi:hypothetical protein